ncbi:MAG: tetratricopeptide repeat protein [Acidobacteria bacterium]|nr:tetratricopeptide repeat protein [Acidobacteriota bacterium]
MPNQPESTIQSTAGMWNSREAYLLALVCLMTGILIGYIFHGSAPTGVPVLSTAAASVPGPGGSGVPGTMPGAKMPTADDLKPLTAPLLSALKVEPNNFDTLSQLGNLYYDHGVFPEAIEFYTRALAVRPKELNVRTDLGTAYWNSGFPEKAVVEYEKSLAVDPKHANTLFNLGIVKFEGLKDAKGAIAAWEKLLASNPSPDQRERAIQLMAKAQGKAN